MKTLLITTLIAYFSTSAFACEQDEISFSKQNVCAKIEWISKPVFNQYTSATVVLKNNSGYAVNVIPWMVMDGGHEHGSRPTKITTVSPDDFLVEKIYFMGGMMGDWFLRIQLLNGKNVIEEVRTKVELD